MGPFGGVSRWFSIRRHSCHGAKKPPVSHVIDSPAKADTCNPSGAGWQAYGSLDLPPRRHTLGPGVEWLPPPPEYPCEGTDLLVVAAESLKGHSRSRPGSERRAVGPQTNTSAENFYWPTETPPEDVCELCTEPVSQCGRALYTGGCGHTFHFACLVAHTGPTNPRCLRCEADAKLGALATDIPPLPMQPSIQRVQATPPTRSPPEPLRPLSKSYSTPPFSSPLNPTHTKAQYTRSLPSNPPHHHVTHTLPPWYRGPITRHQSEVLLASDGRHGAFLVRESESMPGTYTLSYNCGGQILHSRIVTATQHPHGPPSYSLTDERSFPSLERLIAHYAAPASMQQGVGECCEAHAAAMEAGGDPTWHECTRPTLGNTPVELYLMYPCA